MVVGSPTKLNLIPSGVMPVVYINQGDAGYDKEFLIYNGDSPYNVPAGVSATIRGKKADGYGMTEAAALTEGSNLVTVTMTEQMIAAAGTNIYELVFVDTNGLRVATINMVWAVKADALGNAVISESDLDYASQVLNQLQSVSAFKVQLDANTRNIADNAEDLTTEAAARALADNALQNNINAEAAARSAQDGTLQAQINQLAAPTGTAPSAAEVENARISASGVTYSTLGESIRTQVNDINNTLENAPQLNLSDAASWDSQDGFLQTYSNFGFAGLGSGTYTLEVNASSTRAFDYVYIKMLKAVNYSAANVVFEKTISKNGVTFVFTLNEPVKSIYITAAASISGSSGYTVSLTDFKVYKGIHLDNTKTYDITEVLQEKLNAEKAVYLAPGDYSIKNVVMPEGSAIVGSGDQSKIYFDDTATGIAINMGSRCSVKDLSLLGSETDITIPTSEAEADILDGVQFTSDDGFISALTTIAPGSYKMQINATSNKSSSSELTLAILDQQNYSSSHIIVQKSIPKNQDTTLAFSIEKAGESIYILAGGTVGASAGYTVTLNSIALYWNKIGSRHGIGWTDSANMFGKISGCKLSRFNGAGLIARDTGTPIDHNLIVSDRVFTNNNAGVFIQRDSEFNRITNCEMVNNYYGVLNRGGNNYLSNCGIDQNVVGYQADDNEGSNHGHGGIDNCSINHSDSNAGYGLIISKTGRMMVSNCNFYYSKIKLEDTNGNVINCCGFGRAAGWDITGGACSMFIGCIVRAAADTPITVNNNDTVKLINCYTRSGDALVLP